MWNALASLRGAGARHDAVPAGPRLPAATPPPLPSPDSAADASVTRLTEALKAELQQRFAAGDSAAVAEFLDAYPALRDHPDRVLSLIYEEFCLREERGDAPDPSAFCDRYPDYRDSLASQLRYHRVISRVVGPTGPAPTFPEPGEFFEEFQVLGVLGRGGAARVFLARDFSLGDRPVVLKVSPDRGNEPSIHGPLNHANIVPVHSVVYQTETSLRGLSMPYRPGLALDEVIRRVDPASRPRDALALWRALTTAPVIPPLDDPKACETVGSWDLWRAASAHARGLAAAPAPTGRGWDGFPAGGTYADAVAWVVAALARALHHAHTLGVRHRDVKPANVLLTLDEGPQLLDFNLAHAPHSAEQAHAALQGGTLPYMAPEQLRAFLDPAGWDDVGPEADQYSLGLLLRELLTGQTPETPEPGVPLPRAILGLLDRRVMLRPDILASNPRLPHALEAITTLCLAADPADRYPDLAALADDLDRYLDRRPLAHATNPSRAERTRNALYRRRKVLVATACGAAAVAVVSGMLLTGRGPAVPEESTDPSASPAFQEAVELAAAHRWEDAARALSRSKAGGPVSAFYRALVNAYPQGGQVDQVQGWLRKLWGGPDPTPALRAWAETHPLMAKEASQIAEFLVNGYEGRALPDSPHLIAAERTLDFAESLSPGSTDMLEVRALLAEKRGDLRRAERVLTELIELAGGFNQPVDSVPQVLRKAALERSRVTIEMARRLFPGETLPSAESLRRTRGLLDAAESDAANVIRLRQSKDPRSFGQATLLRCHQRLAVRDLESLLGRRAEADAAFREARAFLKELDLKVYAYMADAIHDLERRVGAAPPAPIAAGTTATSAQAR